MSLLEQAAKDANLALEFEKEGNQEECENAWERAISKLLVHLKNDSTSEAYKKILSKRIDQYLVKLKQLKDETPGKLPEVKPKLSWSMVVGLTKAKKILEECIILPQKFPHLFQGQRKPWRAILLYGPPGTGKSLLARVVAEQTNSSFFVAEGSELLNKYIGESEKQIRRLFDEARQKPNSVIFIDEVDSLCGQREDGGDGTEASRRIKTEFMTQMSGFKTSSDTLVVIAATNNPWSLDPAIRRRFEKRLMIPLPEEESRKEIIQKELGDFLVPPEIIQDLARKTEGFSGADLSILCRDAIMAPLRECQEAKRFKKTDDGFWEASDDGGDEMTIFDLPEPSKLRLRDIKESDFQDLGKPSVAEEELEKFNLWTKKYGGNGD